MAVEDYDTGVTRKTIDEVTAADRAKARLNVDPTGSRWNPDTNWWNETFMPEYTDREYGQGGGYYAPTGTVESFGGDDYWTDDRAAFGGTGYADPFGNPVEGPPKDKKPPPKKGASDDYKA